MSPRKRNSLPTASTHDLMLTEYVDDDIVFVGVVQNYLTITQHGLIFGLDADDHRSLVDGPATFKLQNEQAHRVVLALRQLKWKMTLQNVSRFLIQRK